MRKVRINEIYIKYEKSKNTRNKEIKKRNELNNFGAFNTKW